MVSFVLKLIVLIFLSVAGADAYGCDHDCGSNEPSPAPAPPPKTPMPVLTVKRFSSCDCTGKADSSTVYDGTGDVAS